MVYGICPVGQKNEWNAEWDVRATPPQLEKTLRVSNNGKPSNQILQNSHGIQVNTKMEIFGFNIMYMQYHVPADKGTSSAVQ